MLCSMGQTSTRSSRSKYLAISYPYRGPDSRRPRTAYSPGSSGRSLIARDTMPPPPITWQVSITMALSARNQLPATVVEVNQGGVMAEVVMRLDGGEELVA